MKQAALENRAISACMQMYRSFLLALLAVIAASQAAIQISSAVHNSKVHRIVDLTSNIARITSEIEIQNTGSSSVSKYFVSLTAEQVNHLAFIGASQDGTNLEWSYVTPDDARYAWLYISIILKFCAIFCAIIFSLKLTPF